MSSSTQTRPSISVEEQVVLDRRHLHAHPELGMQEFETSKFVANRLRELGLEVTTGIATTGVVGLLRGGRPGKTVLLRADMDALPIDEQNEVAYKSLTSGVMHACGHDGHTAILLNAARVLTERRHTLSGNVKFLFQPCEERPPGGAKPMIAEGVLENPHVDAVFGLHLAQEMPVGTISAQTGPIMAAADDFHLEITGKGGHAAYPHLCVDAALIAAQVLVALHAIVSREVKPTEPAVITVGMIQAGSAPNVIPGTALLRGTVRTFDKDLRQSLAKRVEEVAVNVASAMRGEAVCTYVFGYPATVNESTMTDLVAGVAADIVGADRILTRDQAMGGEDFSYFLEQRPGCFFNLGTRNEDRGLIWGHHHPRFDIDEAALPVGINMFVGIVEKYLAP